MSLPTTPSPWQKQQWMVVADCCMPRRWVGVGGTRVALGWRRPSWLKSVSSAHFVRVFCVLFYVDTITVFAENRLRSIINDNISSFNYVALLHNVLVNFWHFHSRGWGTMAAMVRRQTAAAICHGSSCYDKLEPCVTFCRFWVERGFCLESTMM
jgi:hypothetical protein